MAVQWEKVYVFISSTFNDMHAERDYLVKHVFPQLAEWCERRKLSLVDIDLRWGVTEADAAENKRVVQVCLERIDACRPFFLCFLGQRRGWVLASDDISPETYAQYPELERYIGNSSITELEILHALINPLHHGKVLRVEGGVNEYAPAEYSFFYLRQPEYLAELPGDLPQLRKVYTNENIADATLRCNFDQELARWRTIEIPQTGRPVHSYTACWNPAERTPELLLPLQCPSSAERGSPAWHRALARWSRQWENMLGEGVVDASGELTDPDERERAKQFNARLTQGRLTGFTCAGQPLAEIILADLQTAIEARYPNHVEIADLSPLQCELDQQEHFLQIASEGFIEREGDYADLDRYAVDASQSPFFLIAPGGLGKTSLLAHWINIWQKNLKPGESLHYRFIGTSDNSTTVEDLLRSLLSEVKEVAGKIREEIPIELEKLREQLPMLLASAGKRGKTLIILDGLNQLETGLVDLAWLPLVLPPGIKLVASFRRGEPRAESYIENLHARRQVILSVVKPFQSLDDRRKLVRAYLSQFLKELDERFLEALVRSEGAGNPLYLKIVLAELRVFGTFADLGEKLRTDFGTTPISAFAGLLRRLENDPAYSPIPPEQLVPQIFGWLAHARTGLTTEELGGLLMHEQLLRDADTSSQQAAEAVHGLLRQVRMYLSRREGRVDFFYESFKLAVLERYVTRRGQSGAHPESRSTRAWHESLAAFFDSQPLRLGVEKKPNQHKLVELAYHFAHAGMAEPLRRTLWDYQYLKARFEVSGIQALIADYDLANLDEAGISLEARQRLSLLQGALRLSSHVVSLDTLQFPCQLTGRLLKYGEEEFRKLLIGARHATVGPWLRPLTAVYAPPGGPLFRTLLADRNAMMIVVAVTPDGQRVVSGSYDGTLNIWDLNSGESLSSIRGHLSSISAVALTPDGLRAVSGSLDKTLKVWDLETGMELATLIGHSDRVNTVAVTPDGLRVVSGSSDGTLKVWDLETGAELATLIGHSDRVNTVAVTPNGRWVVSGSKDKTLKMWDLESGTFVDLQKVEPFYRKGQYVSKEINAVVVTADGGRAMSGSYQQLRVWDLASGEELAPLRRHSSYFAPLAVTPDGKLAVTGGRAGSLKIWDLEKGVELASLEGHKKVVRSVVLTSDGKQIVSASQDKTVKIWDISVALNLNSEIGVAKTPLFGISEFMIAVAVTPDGRRAVFVSPDKKLKVWDIESRGEPRSMSGYVGSENVVAVTPDGQTAVSRSVDPDNLVMWNLESGEKQETLRGHSGFVTAVALTPDGRRVVSGSKDRRLKVWDLESGVELATMRGHSWNICALAVTPDGQRVVTGSEDRTLKIWDLDSEVELATLRGHSLDVCAVAVTPDGRWVVSGSKDRTVKVWDSEKGSEYITIRGHREKVNSVAITPDGRRIVSASEDQTLRVWDLESGNLVATFYEEAPLSTCCALPEGTSIIAGGSRCIGHILRLENVYRGIRIGTVWQVQIQGTKGCSSKQLSLAFGCPLCRVWSSVQSSALGTDINCSNCGKPVRINPFTIDADWRSVAKAWQGKA